MSEADQDLAIILARAFDRAWAAYYALGLAPTISEDAARPELARKLVSLAKEGIENEDALAVAGLQHLFLLSPGLHFSATNVRATMIQQWRVPWLRSLKSAQPEPPWN
jgi:hypothetical protein